MLRAQPTEWCALWLQYTAERLACSSFDDFGDTGCKLLHNAVRDRDLSRFQSIQYAQQSTSLAANL